MKACRDKEKLTCMESLAEDTGANEGRAVRLINYMGPGLGTETPWAQALVSALLSILVSGNVGCDVGQILGGVSGAGNIVFGDRFTFISFKYVSFLLFSGHSGLQPTGNAV